jgi:alpha-mannosidase
MYAVLEEAHESLLQREMSLLKVNRENCIVEVVKRAESSDGIIIRLYEYKNMRENVDMTFGMEIKDAYECDLMENVIRIIGSTLNKISFEIMPYEIKTFLINFK